MNTAMAKGEECPKVSGIGSWAGVRLACSGIFLICGGTASGAPLWIKPSLSLGSLNVAGGLQQRFELGVLSGSPEFSFPIHLEHGFKPGEAISDYKAPQLETYVAPEGREELLWLEPGGVRHLFKKSEVLKAVPEKQAEEWVVVEPMAGAHEFHSADGWIYRYQAGAIVSLTAPTGRTLHFDTEGLAIQRIFQEAGGREVTLLEVRQNDLGQMEELSIGPTIHEFSYSAENDQLVKWHSPQMGRGSVAFTYSAGGQVESVTLPDARKLSYTWGGRDGAWQKDSGFELPATAAGTFLISDSDFKFQYGITKDGLNLMRSDAMGIREGFVFNPNTQQLIRKNRDGGETMEAFGVRGTAENRLESVRDARGRETVRITYDEKGRVRTRTAAGQAEIRFEYDDLDRIAKIFRLGELQKSYEYLGDSQKPVKITNALGDTIEMAYMPDGQVKRYKNLDGAVYEYFYDDLGQVIEERHPMGYKKAYERDGFGRITRVQEIDGRETRYEYTGENRLASVRDRESVWNYEYDPDGQLARLLRDGRDWQKIEREEMAGSDRKIRRETNALGDETTLQFDKDGRLLERKNAAGEATVFSHDALGQINALEDERGLVAQLERDAFGRIVAIKEDGAEALKVHYDANGKLKSRTSGGKAIEYLNNKEGQLVRVNHEGQLAVSYAYDACGRMQSAETAQGVRTLYGWDKLDRKTEEKNELPGGMWTLVRWKYTPSGKISSITAYRNGDARDHVVQDTSYHYDDLGRCTRIEVGGRMGIEYKYDPKTLRLKEKVYGNRWVASYAHYPDGWPEWMKVVDAEGKVVKEVHYRWDLLKRLASRTIDGVEQKFEYDKLGRLSAAQPGLQESREQ